jgi:hypothetical protein
MAFLPAMIPYLTAAGAAMSAVSAIKQGKAAKAAAEFNANIARENASIARGQTAQQIAQHDREQYLRMGAIRAAQGKSGGAANEGSVLDILADTAAQGELQRQDIAYRGSLAERGYNNTATLDTMAGKNAAKQGVMQAGADLLSGGASTYDAFKRVKRA